MQIEERAVCAKPRDYFTRISELLDNTATRHHAFQIVKDESGLPAETLRRAYNREFGPVCGHYSLSEDDELKLVCALCALSYVKDPQMPRQVCDVAEHMFGLKLGRKWCCGFIKRHKHVLSVRKPKVLTPSRGREDLVVQTKTFLEQWGGLVTRKLIREDNLFVFDETRVGKGQYQQEVVTCHGDSVDHKEATLKEVFGTFIPFSRAHGDTPFRAYAPGWTNLQKKGQTSL